MLLVSEQKTKEWMMDIVPKFTRTKELVLGTCAGIVVSVKRCLKIPEHGWYIGGKKLSLCFEKTHRLLVGVYTKQA